MIPIMYPKFPQPSLKNPRKVYLINESARENMGRYLPLIAMEFVEGFVVVDGVLSPDYQV